MRKIEKSCLAIAFSVLTEMCIGQSKPPLPAFDFSQASGAAGWQAAHDIAALTRTSEGLVVDINGNDPYLNGPSRDYPAGIDLWLRLRLKSDQGGSCQIFYFPERSSPEESRSIRFTVPAGEWFESRAWLPSLGQRFRLRIDPPGTAGRCVLGSLRFDERAQLAAPDWPKPRLSRFTSHDPTLQAGDLEVIHGSEDLGAFEVRVAGERMASGNSEARIGYLTAGRSRWFSWRDCGHVRVERTAGAFTASGAGTDADGGRWEIKERFAGGPQPGTISIEVRIAVSEDRDVVYLPLLTLLPGLGTFGTNKTQALFAGLEYLENEPSSSEADLRGPASKRQVPDALKQTFPLMALSADGRYIGLIWDEPRKFAAVFDSPDRLFRSGAHVMGLLFPNSDGTNREESSLLPYDGEWVRHDKPLVLRATLIGGIGRTVIPAVQKFVALRGLPPLPPASLPPDEYFALASRSWLDSKIREGDDYRHAFWPGFNPQPAADAAFWMDWLAAQGNDAQLVSRLTAAARKALNRVTPADYNFAAVGHVRYPAPALIYGAVMQNATVAANQGHALLSRFQPDGTVACEKTARGPDYASTHYARHANGLTAQVLSTLFELAIFSGDKDLINAGLDHLRALRVYDGTVPRGAQTWEIPLHTPDILASAHLVRVYTLGYELTGEPHFLEEAKYWAWTGVPFVYLSAPTDQPIGLYSTIPVLGATGWVAPVWIGLPVQWCGLVYAEALYRLARHDAAGPWKQLAEGISLTGMQMTWPATDQQRQGLLPDVFALRTQHRDGPAINPATVLAPAAPFSAKKLPYGFHAFGPGGFLVHAPGEITVSHDSSGRVAFTVNGWPRQPYNILVNRVWHEVEIMINGVPIPRSAPHYEYEKGSGRLVLQLEGKASVDIRTTVK